MAEIVSRQAAKLAAGTKLSPNEAYGKKRTVVITSPATAAWADGDTLASGIPLPIGTRFLAGGWCSYAAMGASVVADVGIRNFETKAVIDADGICLGLSVATAGRGALNSGALVSAGVEYVTTEVVEVYATLRAAAATANAQIRFEVEVATPD